jgi:phosphohistidine phosphatase
MTESKQPTASTPPAKGARTQRARSASGRFISAADRATTEPTTATRASKESSMSAMSAPEAEPLQLYLLRHADAGDPTAWPGDDAERPLSAKGRRQARRLGSMLADIGWRPDLILTSPKVRAADTARLVGRAVDVKPGEDKRLASGFDLSDVGAMLGAHPEAKRVVLVGHDPDFSALASSLTGAAIELRKGAIARIDLQGAKPAAGQGALRWLIPPGVVPD